MCIHVCIYMYIHIHLYMYKDIHMYIHIYINPPIDVYIHPCSYTHTYVYLHIPAIRVYKRETEKEIQKKVKRDRESNYGAASSSRLLKITGLSCKRVL